MVNGSKSRELTSLNVQSMNQTSLVLVEVKKEIELQAVCRLINPNQSLKVSGS